MLSVYPFGTGSLYTASYAISASYADTAQKYWFAESASNANAVLYPRSGSSGKGVCLLTTEQYETLQANILEGLLEDCPFPPEPTVTIPTITPVVKTIEIFPYNIDSKNTFAVSASYTVTASSVQATVTASLAGYAINNVGPTGPAGITVTAIAP